MSILVDDRVGSRHYAPQLANAIVTRLEYGDVAFAGHDCTIGIEIKKIGDAVSSMFSGRLCDHQIPGLFASYDKVYLIVEGLWRPEPGSGVLQQYRSFVKDGPVIPGPGRWFDMSAGRRRLLYGSFEQFLTTLESQAGVKLRYTPSEPETVALISSLYAWHQREDHKSFKVLDETTETQVFTRPTTLRRMLALLPRVGWSRSGILAKRFKSMAEAVAAPPEAWLIEGEIGMDTAVKIVAALSGKAI